MDRLAIDGRWFVDGPGRHVLLRWVNLGGDSKVPTRSAGATHLAQNPASHRDVSFFDRPFPLDLADETFVRCRRWRFRVLRAVEHAGPGLYDEAFLEYIGAVIRRAGDHDVHVIIDPHQDAWSRWSGGDGAPGWTLEAAGFDLARLDASEAAITGDDDQRAESPIGDPSASSGGASRRRIGSLIALSIRLRMSSFGSDSGATFFRLQTVSGRI